MTKAPMKIRTDSMCSAKRARLSELLFRLLTVFAAILLVLACEQPTGAGGEDADSGDDDAIHEGDDSADDTADDSDDGEAVDDEDEDPAPSLTLSLRCDEQASFAPEASISIEQGVAQEISVTPADGLSFVEWEVYVGNDVTIAEPRSATTTVTLNGGSAVLRARLVPSSELVTLTVSAAEGGSVEPDGTLSVVLGEATSVEARAETGYSFARWSVEEGSGVTIASPLQTSSTITLSDGDAEVHAIFLDADTQISGSLLVQAGEGGSVAPAGNHTVLLDDALEISATAEDGYEFETWELGDGDDATIVAAGSAETTATLHSGNATATARFSAIPEYTLTVATGEHGTSNPAEDEPVTALRGTPITISASPSVGYVFDHWQVVYWYSLMGGEWRETESPTGILIADEEAASTSVTLSEGDRAVQPVFVEVPSHSADISNVSWLGATDADHDTYAEAVLLGFDVTVTGSGSFTATIFHSTRGGFPVVHGSTSFDAPARLGTPVEVQYPISGMPVGQHTYDFTIRVSYGSDVLDSYAGSPLTGITMEP